MKRYLVFALVGPFVGGFLLLLTTTYQSGYWAQTNLGEVGKLFAVFFKSLQYSYLFGFLPSLMIGAVDDILIHVRRIGPVLRHDELRAATQGLARSAAHKEVTRLVRLAVEALRDGTPPPEIGRPGRLLEASR